MSDWKRTLKRAMNATQSTTGNVQIAGDVNAAIGGGTPGGTHAVHSEQRSTVVQRDGAEETYRSTTVTTTGGGAGDDNRPLPQ